MTILKIFEDIRNAPLFRQVLVATGPVLITVIYGMTGGYSAVLLPQLQHENSTVQIDKELSSWIASMSTLPMAGGCALGGYLMERIGRRAIHIWACAPLIVGWFLIAVASNSNFILVGRFLTGLSDGLLGPATGVYIAETSHPNVRGVLIMSKSVAINAGVFVVHILGTFLTWRLTAWICAVFAIPITILMICMPESPTYLAKMKRLEDARKAFYWCRGASKESQREFGELIVRQEEINNSPTLSINQQLRGLSKPEFWKPTIIISVLFFTSQLTGNNVIASYTIQILQECGLNDEMFDEYIGMIIMDVFRFIASILSCILVNKMSRRGLAEMSGFGVTLMLFFICCYLYIASRYFFQSSVLLLAMFSIYICFISVGVQPLSWTMMGEVFPLAYRGLGTGITSVVCYIFLFLAVHTFPYLLEYFGNMLRVFAFYAVCTLLGTVFLVLFLPETKDKPLYVIEDHFKSKKCKAKLNDYVT